MKQLVLAVLIVLGLSASMTRADETMREEMLYPSAQVFAGQGRGSATAVRVDSIMGTYLVTNYHVVTGNLDDLEVQFYGQEERHQAYVHSIDPQHDIAIIIVRYEHEYVAMVGNPPDVFDEVYCIGGSLGEGLAPSGGIISGVNYRVFGTRFMTRTDCNIAPGNSGGGMFALQDGHWRYVGMPSLGRVLNLGFTQVPITFLGLAVRVEEIRMHLHQHGVLRLPVIRRDGVN